MNAKETPAATEPELTALVFSAVILAVFFAVTSRSPPTVNLLPETIASTLPWTVFVTITPLMAITTPAPNALPPEASAVASALASRF